MQQLDILIKQYLENNTDYAVLLTGQWGTGKTYYFNHVIRPVIDNTNFYKTISVSLFGLNDIGEIQTQILLSSINLFNDKKKNKITTTILGTLSKELLKNTIDTSIWSELINNIKGFENLVLCFDDIERRSNSFEISQFIGFVNMLIEKHKAKVILIANEEKIESFGESKEKVIGNTIHYMPDYELIFDSIIQKDFKNYTEYSGFLQSKKTLILSLFNNTSKNLRTLKYALNQFREIYLKIQELIKIEVYLDDKKYEILTDALRFTYVISEEYRSGIISFIDKKELDTFDAFSMMLKRQLEDQEGIEINNKNEDDTFINSFSAKYYTNHNYFYWGGLYMHLLQVEMIST